MTTHRAYRDKLGGQWMTFSHREVIESGMAMAIGPESRITPRTVYVAAEDLPLLRDYMIERGIDVDSIPVHESTESSIRKCAHYSPSWLNVDVHPGRTFLFQGEPYVVNDVDTYDRGRVIMFSLEGHPPKKAMFNYLNIYAMLERDPHEDPLLDFKRYLQEHDFDGSLARKYNLQEKPLLRASSASSTSEMRM